MRNERLTVMIACDWCDETGHYPGSRVVCQKCWATKQVPYVVNCEHGWSWVGYGLEGDQQWDGANQCETCDAIFAVWPREVPDDR